MIYFVIFMLGASIGSFCNVMLSRSDWYKGRSHCDSCGYILKWYDLIPVLSYIFLFGKCRKCGKRIGFEHLLSEVYMGDAFLCISYLYEATNLMYAIVAGTGLIFLCLAAIEDFKEQMVHSVILYLGIAILVIERAICSAISVEWMSFAEVVAGVLIIKIAGYILCKKYPESIGEGDFDLFAIMMLIFGITNFVYALTASCIIGLIIYLPQVLIRKRNYKMVIPFGPLLFIGSMTTLFVGGFI